LRCSCSTLISQSKYLRFVNTFVSLQILPTHCFNPEKTCRFSYPSVSSMTPPRWVSSVRHPITPMSALLRPVATYHVVNLLHLGFNILKFPPLSPQYTHSNTKRTSAYCVCDLVPHVLQRPVKICLLAAMPLFAHRTSKVQNVHCCFFARHVHVWRC
jgi:hypothetical protein